MCHSGAKTILQVEIVGRGLYHKANFRVTSGSAQNGRGNDQCRGQHVGLTAVA